MNTKKFLFYIISFTWGLPLTFIGCLVAAVLTVFGYKPKKFGCCYYYEVGNGWGGFELGPLFLVNKESSDLIKTHELGHSIQNCIFGPFTLLLVTIPSAIRYWYREFRTSKGLKNNTSYYSIWFEKQADLLGEWYLKLTGIN